jgi:hypothetical protein
VPPLEPGQPAPRLHFPLFAADSSADCEMDTRSICAPFAVRICDALCLSTPPNPPHGYDLLALRILCLVSLSGGL